MKITLLDCGVSNVASVERSLERLGAQSQRAATPECVANADALLLPGVGHFEALIRVLDDRKLRKPLCDAIRRGVPFLGICLGLQALYDASDEAPKLTGLKLLPGRVCALPPLAKLPHMGWNRLISKNRSRLLEGVEVDAYFYFAHSYAAIEQGPETAAVCDYGTEFVAVVEKENMCAVQFHPEKSGEAGVQVLRNFLRLCA
ncbi:MAG: hisH [Candidatus Acidoferrum typicum]|nr:hisH [Candidatus Acidoferrum typicum]